MELEAVLSTELFHAISVVPGVGLDLYVVARDVSWDSVSRYTQFTCFTSTKVPILTHARDVTWDSESRYCVHTPNIT